jgi:amino acid adenylation domain-containing protein
MKILASYHQKRLWFQEKAHSRSRVESRQLNHHLPLILKIQGPLDFHNLEKSIQWVINRQEALRTTISQEQEQLFQVIHRKSDFKLSLVKTFSTDSQKGLTSFYKTLSIAIQESTNPFLEEEEMFIRGTLISFSDQEFVLAMTLHRYIADRHSLHILLQEIFTCYENLQWGRNHCWPEIPLHYVDLSQWQQGLSDEIIENLLLYWRTKIGTENDPLEMPMDRSKAISPGFRTGRKAMKIDWDLSDHVKKTSQNEEVKVSSVLLTVFKILLFRYTNQGSVAVGTHFRNRNLIGLENVVGPISNLVILLDELRADQTFSELVKEVDATVMEALQHQEIPYEWVIQELNANREEAWLNSDKLANILFEYDEAPVMAPKTEGLELEYIETNLGWEDYDLNLYLMEKEEQFTGILVYNARYFNESRINRFSDHFQELLRNSLLEPKTKISKLSFLGEEERHQLVDLWNQESKISTLNGEDKGTLHHLFEKVAHTHSQRIAVVHHLSVFTYDEIQKLANEAGQHLKQRPLMNNNGMVCVLMEPSEAMIYWLLGILQSGGAYVPIDPGYPPARINYILKDTETGIVVAEEIHKEKVNNEYKDWLIESGVVQPGKKKNHSNIIEKTVIDSNRTAYVIYTSGTTGEPKGCMVSHRNVMDLIQNIQPLFNFSCEDIWMMSHTYCFDFSVWEMYGALLNGGKLVVPDRDRVRDPYKLLIHMKQQKITVFNSTPVAFYPLAQLEKRSNEGTLRSHLRYVIFGGDRLEFHLLRGWVSLYPIKDIQLINMYGITETTIHVTYYPIEEADIYSPFNKSIIGRPLPGMKVVILDPFLNLLPLGIPGELYIGGTGISRGYWNREALTRERFIENPFQRGERLYCSGDLGRWLDDGNIEYIGRRDLQVKIRGYRIELQEIRFKLMKHPQIKDAWIRLFEDVKKDKALCAYYVVKEGINFKNELNLNLYLSKELPGYMIPSRFIQINRIPLNSNGKIDIHKLPDPLQDHDKPLQEKELPQNQTERRLVYIWREIFQIKKIGTMDNFFDIGGHSIKALQLINSIQKQFNLKIHIEEVFRVTTIKELASLIRTRNKNFKESIRHQEEKEYYELTYSQKRIWLLFEMESQNRAFHISGHITLQEKVEEAQIRTVLYNIAERHESFRTSFNKVDGTIVQMIHSKVDIPLSLRDYSLQKEKQEKTAAQSDCPFDLTKAPLFRATLVKWGEENFTFIFTLHHIITDGWSMNILEREFFLLYESVKNKTKPELELLRIRYRDFAFWSNQLLSNESKIKEAREFWLKYLGRECPSLNLPYDFSYEKLKTRESSGYRTILKGSIYQKLKEKSKENQVSLFILLLSAFNLLINRLTGDEEIMVGVPAAARPHDDLKTIVGLFVNTLIIKQRINPAETFCDYLQELRENTFKVMEYQDFPLELIFRELQVRYPGITVFFNMQVAGSQKTLNPEIHSPSHIGRVQDAKFDLVLYLAEYSNGIEINTHYYSELFKPQTIEKIMELYKKIMDSITDGKTTLVREIVRTGQKKKRKLKRDTC